MNKMMVMTIMLVIIVMVMMVMIVMMVNSESCLCAGIRLDRVGFRNLILLVRVPRYLRLPFTIRSSFIIGPILD